MYLRFEFGWIFCWLVDSYTNSNKLYDAFIHPFSFHSVTYKYNTLWLQATAVAIGIVQFPPCSPLLFSVRAIYVWCISAMLSALELLSISTALKKSSAQFKNTNFCIYSIFLEKVNLYNSISLFSVGKKKQIVLSFQILTVYSIL